MIHYKYMEINKFEILIKNTEIVCKDDIVLFVATEYESNYLVVNDNEQKFRREIKEKFNIIIPKFNKKSWDIFLNSLREGAIAGSITEDSYTEELVRRILQRDTSLCLEQTTLDKIQSVLDSMDIIVPATVFKHIFAEWGFPILRKRKKGDKKFPYGLTPDLAYNELRSGVIYW